jgi:HAD superfamily hydrolase (TIGR01549 family)
MDITVDAETLREIRERYRAEYEAQARQAVPGIVDGYRVFPEVLPVMRRLTEAGILRAVISNADEDVTEFCKRLAFADDMDLIVTSATVGWEKPDVRTFRAALDPLGVRPEEALHIGDQPRSDVAGALATGMRAALLDRYGRHDPANHAVPVVRSLTELVDAVLAERAATPAGATS